MRKTITYCDVFKTEDGKPLSIYERSKFNGVDNDDEYYRIDLGHDAAMQTLRYIQEKVLTQVQREALISYLEKIKKS